MTDSCLPQSAPAMPQELSFKSGSISYSVLLASLFQISRANVQISTLDLRSDQQTCERAAKLDIKAAFAAAFASLSALPFPEMPSRKTKRVKELCWWMTAETTKITLSNLTGRTSRPTRHPVVGKEVGKKKKEERDRTT